MPVRKRPIRPPPSGRLHVSPPVFPTRSGTRPWTRDSILVEIRRRADAGMNVRIARRHPASLVRRAKEFYGSWPQALEAALGPP